ncbi:MAG TPA: single-stranded-DNA-specific exonuclease RecJ, partial [Cyclobacteriaceae bacterium]|nr:single-stranded-DNA-specific exonuclease RecJ [Cyclobacteriaceae bacterium]
MEKRWIHKDPPPREAVEKLSKEININAYLATVLVQRGTNSFETAKNYFRPALSQLHDPLLMKDMQHAVNRLKRA